MKTKMKPWLILITMMITIVTLSGCSNSNLSGIQQQLNDKYSDDNIIDDDGDDINPAMVTPVGGAGSEEETEPTDPDDEWLSAADDETEEVGVLEIHNNLCTEYLNNIVVTRLLKKSSTVFFCEEYSQKYKKITKIIENFINL